MKKKGYSKWTVAEWFRTAGFRGGPDRVAEELISAGYMPYDGLQKKTGVDARRWYEADVKRYIKERKERQRALKNHAMAVVAGVAGPPMFASPPQMQLPLPTTNETVNELKSLSALMNDMRQQQESTKRMLAIILNSLNGHITK